MPRKFYPIKAFGFETQAPQWALTVFALVLIAAAAMLLYRKTVLDPDQQLVSLQDANKQLAAEIEEYSLHAMEEPEKHELFEEQDGRLVLRVFKDHCVLIQRQTRRGTRTKLVIDLERGNPRIAQHHVPPPAEWGLFPVVEAAGADPCRRGCLNPHPGTFRWWYGDRRGTWVEVWRQWPEGCTHFQMFHPQTGTWEANPDGTPRVRWTCCIH